MSRFYTVQFNAVTATAVQDLFNISATSGMAFKLHQLELGSDNQTAVGEVRVSIKRLTATVTNGTGGSSATMIPLLSTDSAATITGRTNDATTRASTSGSTSLLFELGWNLLNGLIFIPAPEYRPSFAISQNLLIGLETAPSSAIIDGYIILEEAF
jgi:hypothetical protein